MLTLWMVYVLGAMPMFEMDAVRVDEYLSDLRARVPEFSDRVVEICKESLGTPYMENPLGEGEDGLYDRQPLMDLAHVDCVTFVEQTIALAASRSFQEAFDTLQRIRYKNGQIAFETRNHFMIADWIANNHFCRDITGELGVPTVTETRMMGRRHFFEVWKIESLAKEAQDEPLTIDYIASSDAARAMDCLPSPSLVLLIGKLDWLFSLHCGIFIRDEDGRGRLYNASQLERKVVAADFVEIVSRSRYVGFTVYEIGEPEWR